MPTMTAIAPGHWLDAPAAASWNRMGAAGRPADGITDAGRTNAQQWVMWRDYLAGKLKATAAYPGTSKHETGNALDLSGATLAWVRAHGAAYGWIKDCVANEPWHMEYQAARDTHPAPATPARPAPTPLHLSEEDDMTRFIELLYLAYLNRSGSASDVLALAKQAQAGGWSLAQLEAAFMTNHAEPGTVVAAFRHFMVDGPNAEQIAVWSDTETIAEVWAGVGGSPAVIARR